VFVLGIDPGLSRCGYCVLDGRSRQARAVAMGVMRTTPDDAVWDRLAMLQSDVRGLMADYDISSVALERVVFGANVSTASGVLQAAGVVMCEAVTAGASVAEYAPSQIKEAVTGWGAAPKEQVGQMVASLLGLAEVPRPADAADAAAIALCHLAMAPLAASAASARRGDGR
jgi:crossover junction endodeoxyribonuclease RuvC